MAQTKLPLHQFDSAVLGSPNFLFIRRDWRINTTAECVQTVCSYAVLAAKFRYDTGGAPTAQVKVVVRFSLVIRMPHYV